MQQGGGGGDGDGATATTAQMQQPVESASPISSRPPASSNLEELMRVSEESDRVGGGASVGGSSGGNRWPRQETLALLKIRSDMDAAFRDATAKGPLWEDVSRKLGELGYRRSAKKCKEKFENVHKYYKRTKEGRAGRQDGKSYKFFSQLEALQSTATPTTNLSMPVSSSAAAATLDVAPVSIGIPIPMPISSSIRIQPIPIPPSSSTLPTSSLFPPDLSTSMPPGSSSTPPPPPPTTTTPNIGVSFSSNSSSSSPETDDDDDIAFAGQPSNTAGSSRKRKRQSSSSTHRMMDFFESLMKQVMQKQEAMQQRFLEVIEKREQDRMIREEAWKRQEMARLAREHELMSQERAISASRDAAIISFLQKVTGQTIQLPTAASAAAPPPPAPPPPPPAAFTPHPHPHPPPPAVTVHIPSTVSQERRDQQKPLQPQQRQQVQHQPPSTSIPSDVVMAIPEQQIPPSQEMGGGSFEPSSSSRWPKVEVLALIKLRSGLEHRYQEAGPKGPLWEEISAGMHRMGYKRSSKRCKEKWENINKYFKKVKESNKKRPEDAKTCPYFHELDELYRKKIIGSTSGGTSSSISGVNIQEQGQPQQHQQEGINLDPTPSTNIPQESSNVPAIMPPAGAPQEQTQAPETKNKNESSHVNAAQASNLVFPGSLFGEGDGGASNKPEDIVKELMNQQGMQQQQQPSVVDHFDKIGEPTVGSDSESMDHEEDDEEDEDDVEEEEELEEERKNMGYKVEFQRQNTSATNGGSGNGAPSFLAMVQ